MSIDFFTTARTIASTLFINDSIQSYTMLRDDFGNEVIARMVTPTGGIIVFGIEEDEDGQFITYSLYTPGDTDLEEEITTDGFEVESEEQATEAMATIVAGF